MVIAPYLSFNTDGNASLTDSSVGKAATSGSSRTVFVS